MWLGEIPSHWEESTIKALTRVVSRKNRPNEPLLSVYRDYGVILKSSRDDNYNRPGQDLSAYKYVKPTNLVLNKMKTWQGSLGVSEFHGIVSPAYITCELDISNVFPRYLHYLLRCHNYIHEYNRLSYGVRSNQWDMRYDDFKKIPVFLPSNQEQRAIASFLDYKIAEIDRFIANEEKLIAQLNEQKTVIIDHAVTKGLDPNVEMKPSGVEWIGDICKHWEIKKLKHIVQGGLTNGLFKKKDQFGSGIKLINVTDIYQDDFLVKFEKLDRVEAESHEIETYAVEPGDIFFVRSSLKLEGVAASACIANVPEPIVFECHLVRLRPCPTQVLFKYLISYLNSTQTRQRLITLANTVTMTTIAQPKLASIEVILPPLSEQRIIVDFLDRETKQIDRLISKECQKIELIKQYRQVLISQAVTGKIDVRETA